MKKILITGAGTGIGNAAALALAKRGHLVYATTVDDAQAKELNALAARDGLKIESFKIDVTSEADRQRAAELELDVLLNNAGVGFSGSLAELNLDLVRKNFEVNVFGSLRLTQLALKGMIARKRGTVMFVSSIGGRIPFPFLGSYCMTKYSLEAAAEILRSEMDMLGAGIQVCLIEPGPYYTGFNQSILGNKFDWMGKDSYFADKIDFLKADDAQKLKEMESTDLSSIVDKMVLACEAEKPDMRYFAPESWLPLVKEIETAR
jgi:NAD(P)-dependent dehydrogenase (short-subunit alcohol dehydrogenase family)